MPYTSVSQIFWVTEGFEFSKYLRYSYVLWFLIHHINVSATGFVNN